MAIWLNSDSKILVQGMTGSEGMKHTTRMLASGTNVVGGIKSSSLYTPFLELAEAQWDSTFGLNLKPGFHLIQLIAPGMLAQGAKESIRFSADRYIGWITDTIRDPDERV